MKEWECCDEISFEIVEEPGAEMESGTHVVVCCHCGKVIHLYHFFGMPRLTKVAGKFGLELKP
ncbi:MAG: hypothetical protein ABIQ35_13930 [Verrucomicrobiota bacterium]